MVSPTKTHPVIFIHGLWIHSSAWQPWLELFAANGYAVSAPGWPVTPVPSKKPAPTPTR